jgi:twitching motility protein PilT
MGALIFGTLHTSSAAKTIDRMIDAFPADQQAQARATLSDSLAAVVSQLLCRRVGGGRVAAYEILIRTSALPGAIREANTSMINSIIATGRSEGMQTMDDTLWRLAEEGQIEGYEAYLKASDKKRFAKYADAS